MHRCLVAVCCSVGCKIEVNVLNMICKWKELLWVVTWHMTCVLYCCCRETILRGILLSQHTHIGFPLSTNCAPVVSPIICTWLPTSDRVLATLKFQDLSSWDFLHFLQLMNRVLDIWYQEETLDPLNWTTVSYGKTSKWKGQHLNFHVWLHCNCYTRLFLHINLAYT